MPHEERIRDRGMPEPSARDLAILDAIEDSGSTTAEILRKLGAVDSFEGREALIGFLTRMEGEGLITRRFARGDSPSYWTKGRQT